MTYEITKNEAFKSFEIAFDGKPSEAVRDALKALKFRWHGVKKVWYGYSDEETIRTAIDDAKAEAPKAEKPVAKAEKVNKFGVEVGDVFYMSWGYDQTNVDFFQVVALCGESSVRVRNVSPTVVNTDSEGFMCAHYTYNLTKELMAKGNANVFIKDNDKGDIKRIQMWGDVPYIRIENHIATKVPHGEKRVYESWYA